MRSKLLFHTDSTTRLFSLLFSFFLLVKQDKARCNTALRPLAVTKTLTTLQLTWRTPLQLISCKCEGTTSTTPNVQGSSISTSSCPPTQALLIRCSKRRGHFVTGWEHEGLASVLWWRPSASSESCQSPPLLSATKPERREEADDSVNLCQALQPAGTMGTSLLPSAQARQPSKCCSSDSASQLNPLTMFLNWSISLPVGGVNVELCSTPLQRLLSVLQPRAVPSRPHRAAATRRSFPPHSAAATRPSFPPSQTRAGTWGGRCGAGAVTGAGCSPGRDLAPSEASWAGRGGSEGSRDLLRWWRMWRVKPGMVFCPHSQCPSCREEQ